MEDDELCRMGKYWMGEVGRGSTWGFTWKSPFLDGNYTT